MAITSAGLRRVGLLGTRYTMSHAFFREQYAQRGIDVIVPDAGDAKRVNEIIFRELIHGTVNPASRTFYAEVASRLAARGAEAVVMGCTEIGLIMSLEDSPVRLFDTAALHAEMALNWLLIGKPSLKVG